MALAVFKDEARRNRHGSFALVRLPRMPDRAAVGDNGGELFNEASGQFLGVESINAAQRMYGV
ncbi:hypothetical protein [Bradyrhizobium sp. AUGA SZCCT0283]|uniref:hypothetical protein n=1 Tax=Bradyrhizobium sp. AUGA SZCCT0283 TaxID=2807671 RepID=UPI001BACC1A5|nr:hypothetical protein [Bradyrhizobium sp. AUGA SZCCT0283]MBR1277031.1 hypothetical protein [Bradyrhizobium sp. AUGA SZCCT0283]